MFRNYFFFRKKNIFRYFPEVDSRTGVASLCARKFAPITTERGPWNGAKVERAVFVVVLGTYRCVKPTSSYHNEGLTTGIHVARPFAHVTCKNHPPSRLKYEKISAWGWLGPWLAPWVAECRERGDEHPFFPSSDLVLRSLSSRAEKSTSG